MFCLHVDLDNDANRSFVGHLREGGKVRHRHHRQKEVPRPRRLDRGSICLCDPQENQVVTREGYLYLRR